MHLGGVRMRCRRRSLHASTDPAPQDTYGAAAENPRMPCALLLAVAPALVATNVLVADPFASGVGGRASTEAGTLGDLTDAASARRALRAASAASSRVPVSEAWRALRATAAHDSAVRERMDSLLPALPMVRGSGSASALTHAYEQALRDAGKVPLSADPARRRGVLEVSLAFRPEGARADGEAAWVVDATALLRPAAGGAPLRIIVSTVVTGKSARDVADRAPEPAAEALARALVAELGRSAEPKLTSDVIASRRTLEAVAELRERARTEARVKAALAAFPAQLVVSVDADGAASGAWDRALERAFVDISRDALPLVLAPAGYQLRVQTRVAEVGRRHQVDHPKHRSARSFTVRTTLQLTTEDGRALTESSHNLEVEAASAVHAAEAGAERVARGGYDSLVEQVVARVNRLGQRRAGR